MNAPLPVVWHDFRFLVGGFQSPFKGLYACHWIGWPSLGVSFLHSMTKREDA